MTNVYDKLVEKGITLPAPPPKGGVYTPVQEFGANLLYCSGCGPDLGNGNTVIGKLGRDLTPNLPDTSYEALSSMVTSINRQEVSPEEQLSNQVYLFSRKDGSLKIVSNAPELVGTAVLS